jgi:ATP adenylyltransferase
LLALPREHHLNFAEMIGRSPGIDAELAGLAEKWEKLFGPLTWFEHGPKEAGSEVGCSIDHAHMHLVPLGDINLVHAAETHLGGTRFAPIEAFDDIRDAIRYDRSYLYIRLPDGTQWLASSNSIPSQSLRRAIAIEQGRAEEWDWNDSPGHDLLTETIARATSLR